MYTCGCAASAPLAQGTSRLSGVIDMHCHLVTPDVVDLVRDRPEFAAMMKTMPALMGEQSFRHNLAIETATLSRLRDPHERLADMDLMGVAVQAVSPAPSQYYYWADRVLADRLVNAQNTHLESLCRDHPGRFVAFGAIAMQFPDLAEQQLASAMARGFKGVEVSTRIGDLDLADPLFDRIWALAAESGAVVFVHPLGSSMGARLADDYLANIVGQPVETAIALSKLIFAGVLDRHPKLKLLAAHGGGYLPGFLGRSDHAHAVRPDSQRCRDRPSAYLRRIWFDTVVHSPQVLTNLLTVAGPSQIVAGSDYPYDMGEYRLADLLAEAGLSGAEQRAIASGNARDLLRLPEPKQ